MPHPAGSTPAPSMGGRRPFAGRRGESTPHCIWLQKLRREAQCSSTSALATPPPFFNGFLVLMLLKTHPRCLSDTRTRSQPSQPLPWLLLGFSKPLHSPGPLIFPPAPMFYALFMPPFLLINFSHYLACPSCPLLFNLLLTSHHNPWASL